MSAWTKVEIGAAVRDAAGVRFALRLELTENLWGGQKLLYVSKVDTDFPRRKAAAVLPGPIVAPDGGSHSDLLRMIADLLDGADVSVTSEDTNG